MVQIPYEMSLSCEHSLTHAAPGDHAAFLYMDEVSLVEAVGLYADAALAREEAVILVVTDQHAESMLQELERLGHNCDELCREGRLVWFDANEVVDRIIVDGSPDRTAFTNYLRPHLESVQQRHGRMAVFGEAVNILWQEGHREAAHALEQWWNELIASCDFSLICAYRVDLFDYHEQVQDGIEMICCTHTHLLPLLDEERLERAVNAAMREVFCNGDADNLREHLLKRCGQQTLMPPALGALFALRDILPSLAQDVRMIAREHYRRDTIRAKRQAAADSLHIEFTEFAQ